MPVTINISGDSAEQVHAEVARLFSLGINPATLPPAAAPETARKPRGRPPAGAATPPAAPAAPASVFDAPATAAPAAAAGGGLFDDTPSQPAAPPATRDSIRAALTDYGNTYGFPAAQEDGPKIIGMPKISDLPDTTDWGKVANDIRSAIVNNPYSRTKAA